MLRFGACEIDPAARELRMAGAPVRVGERGFDVLLELVRARGEVVGREALLDRVWRDAVVGDENLKVQVMALRKLVGAEIIVTVPGRGYRLGVPVQEVTPSAPARGSSGTLIGRERELAQVVSLVQPGALLTVVGSGGVGKTRLARAAADAARASFADGMAFVELASLGDPAALPAAVARTIDLPPLPSPVTAQRLAAALATLELLLVLDNCEHLIDAAAALAQALAQAAPRVALLATSQQPLALAHERLLRLSGLAPADTASRLFVERVQQQDAAFAPDAAARAAIGRICERLDGLPLAIELAAARVPMLGVAGVLERLDRQLALLGGASARDAPARHRTLRAALQWSHGLLDAAEQRAFRRLGVFADRFTLDAAAAVLELDDEWALLDTLGSLVAKSLLQALDGPAGQRRYRLLVTARDFALEHLAEAGEEAATRERHARWVVARFDAAEDAFLGAPLKGWVDALWPDAPELREALRWATRPGADPALHVALVGAAGGFMAAAQLIAGALPWAAVARPPLPEGTPPLRAARWWAALAHTLTDPAKPVADAVAAARLAAAAFRDAGDAMGEYRMQALVAQHARRVERGFDPQPVLERMRQLEGPEWSAAQRAPLRTASAIATARAGDWQGYRDRFAAEAQVHRAVGDDLRLWGALHHVALADVALGRPQEAVRVMTPVVEALRAAGLLRAQWTRPAVCLVARIEAGETTSAAAAVREVVALLRIANDPGWIADHMALWAAQCGAFDDAARLIGWADANFERSGERRHSHGQAALDKTLALLRDHLDGARIEQCRAAGRLLDGEVALQIVLRIAGP